MKIMVVDDEPDIVYLIKIMLKKEGYEVVGACSGEECLQKLKSEKVDIIFLDEIMPGIGGWEALKVMRRNEKLNSIPVVMLTARSLDEVKRGEALDEVYYLPKPFERSDLLEVIEHIQGEYD